ncbi:MAG: ChrR family anti-sigma-E factor [Alphaproteobacteria bacterium]|nr:ChrR family anti-sigma-E factor [Alphaproteobacteria bacterium]
MVLRSSTLPENYEALLFSYACGALDAAQELIVAAHLCYSPRARKIVEYYEKIGGCLMDCDCGTVPMRDGAMDHVLARLDSCTGKDPQACARDCAFPEKIDLPAILRDQINTSIAQGKMRTVWRSLLPGLQTLDLAIGDNTSKARFYKLAPAMRTPAHGHAGTEITLVLHGSYHDESGQYHCGDLAVADERMDHRQIACAQQGCVCLTVTTAPVKLSGWMRLLTPFYS